MTGVALVDAGGRNGFNAGAGTAGMSSYRCDGCGASLGAREELDREPGVAGRSWYCTYCGVSVPARVAERIQHDRDGSPTDRRP